jgi:thymidylate kinase
MTPLLHSVQGNGGAINIENSDQTKMLRAFFTHLDRAGIPYCVMGMTDSLPDVVPSDVDIVVPHAHLTNIGSCVGRFCRENGALTVQRLQHECTAFYFVIAWSIGNGDPHFLALDVCSHYLRQGRRFIDAEKLLAGRVPAISSDGLNKGFFVAQPHMEFIYYLLKKLDKGCLDQRQAQHLTHTFRSSPEKSQDELSQLFPPDFVARINEAVTRGDWSQIVQDKVLFRRRLRKSMIWQTLAVPAREIPRMLHRALVPTGLTVGFLGPDGSGKSTVIDRVSESIRPAFRRYRIIHLRPRVGPKPTVGKQVTNPHIDPPRGAIISLLKLIYLLVDYLLGWLLVVRPAVTESTLVVFDRYYHDLLVDRRRFRYGGPLWAARLIGKLVPKPNLWVLLNVPPDVLQARKSEVPYEESARQQAEYKALVNSFRNHIIVDASKPLNEVVVIVSAAILERLGERTKARVARDYE